MELLLPQGKLILSRGKLPLAGLVAGGRVLIPIGFLLL